MHRVRPRGAFGVERVGKPRHVDQRRRGFAPGACGVGLTDLPAELFEMTQLRELRVRENPLPSNTIDALKEALPDCRIY